MSEHKLTITITEDGVTHDLEGIPAEAWSKFVEGAKQHFPKRGDDAWAAYLTEVILAAAGGDETVTFFMTDVPRANADAIHSILQQINFTWEMFHAYLLRSAVLQGHTRLINILPVQGEQPKMGVFIATGLDTEAFRKIEIATGKSFEQVMGTIFLAAAQGKVSFTPETTFIEATPPAD